jgi:DNA replication protein DnaC
VSAGLRPCPHGLCDGDGFLYDEETNTARPCRCRPQRISRARARSLSAVIPKRYREVSFERAPLVDMSPDIKGPVQGFVRRIDENLEAGNGLCFLGDVGTGKTTLAMFVSKAALEAGRSVAIYSLPRLLTAIRTTFSDDAAHSHSELLDKLAAVDLLHLDDLGAENSTPWVLEELYSIVNTRYEEQRSIVVTTNLGRVELREQIGERTVSRLSEMCLDVPVFGHDRRTERFTAA